MIIYCDLNPKITRKYKVNNFKKNTKNEADELRVYASGYGVDSVVFLKNLGANPKLLTFLGGDRGKDIKSKLEEIHVDFDYVRIVDENTEETVIDSKSFKTEIKTKSPRITSESRDDFLLKLSKESAGKSLVCIPELDFEAWGEYTCESMLNICSRRGIDVAIDIQDFDLIGEQTPFIGIVEKEELERYASIMIKTQNDVLRASKIVLNKGISNLIVISENGIIVVNQEKAIKLDYDNVKSDVTQINKNLMLGGIGFGFERKYDFEMTMKFAAACSIVENFVKFRMVAMADIKKLMGNIKVVVI